MNPLFFFIEIAFGLLSTTYGHGELQCGDVHKPRRCEKGAITASGEVFDPQKPTAAVFAPKTLILRPVDVWMQVGDGPCAKIRVNDKGHPRYIGHRGFDLSPGALKALGIKPHKQWSGVVKQCKPKQKQKSSKVFPKAAEKQPNRSKYWFIWSWGQDSENYQR